MFTMNTTKPNTFVTFPIVAMFIKVAKKWFTATIIKT